MPRSTASIRTIGGWGRIPAPDPDCAAGRLSERDLITRLRARSSVPVSTNFMGDRPFSANCDAMHSARLPGRSQYWGPAALVRCRQHPSPSCQRPLRRQIRQTSRTGGEPDVRHAASGHGVGRTQCDPRRVRRDRPTTPSHGAFRKRARRVATRVVGCSSRVRNGRSERRNARRHQRKEPQDGDPTPPRGNC